MPGNKKPRKKYRGTVVHIGVAKNPMLYASESVRPPGQKFVDRLRMQELGAIEAFVKGSASPLDWEVLARMTNASEYLGEHGCGPEAVPVARTAADGLMKALERAKEHGTLGLDGPAITALREVRSFMDLQFQSLTVKELEVHFAGMRREQAKLRKLA